jgi:CBS-domain-containing membrane protein
MEIKQVKEIMVPMETYPHIPYWFTLRQAMAEMEPSVFDSNANRSLSRMSLLVFNEKYELLGMVRRRDFMRGLDSEALQSLSLDFRKMLGQAEQGSSSQKPFSERVMKTIHERAETLVSDVMIPIKATVDQEDSIISVVYEMVENDLSFLSVLKDKEVVGIVCIEDVFHEVARLVLCY